MPEELTVAMLRERLSNPSAVTADTLATQVKVVGA